MVKNEFYLTPLKRDIKVLEHAIMLMKYQQFVAPKKFQRPVAWKQKDKIKFFKSLLMNRVEGTYVLVDLREVLKKLNKFTENETTIFVKDLINQGYYYIVLDGNNRFVFLRELFSDKWVIPQGRYQYISDIDDGSIVSFKVPRGGCKFSELDVDVQNAVEQRDAVVSQYTQICLEGLSEVFENLNSGVPLNHQEHRNASNSLWADYIRELSEKNASLLSMIFKDHVSRLSGDEWIVQCIDFVRSATQIDDAEDRDCHFTANYDGKINFSAINQGSLNALYESPELVPEDKEEFNNVFEDLGQYLKRMISEKVLAEKDILRRSAVQNLYWMMHNGIEDYAQAKEAVKLHQLRYKDKTCTNADYINEKDGEEEKTFKVCCDGLGKDNIEFRYHVLSHIIARVTQ